jgi:hypothetical protein
MTAGQRTRRVSNVSLAPAPLAALLAATLVGGAIIGTGITLQLGSIDTKVAAIGAAAGTAATFDPARFRAEEQAPLGVKAGSCAVSSEQRVHPGQP